MKIKRNFGLENRSRPPGLFVLCFYFSYFTESAIDVVVKTDAQQFDTTMPVQHCPSRTGCRSLLKLADGNNRFPIADNFTLTFLVRRIHSFIKNILRNNLPYFNF